MNQALKTLLFVAIATSPVYVLPSGNPQPADVLFAIAAGVALFRALYLAQGFQRGRFPISWIALTVWVTTVCLAWGLILQSHEFIRYALFWLYNLAIGGLIVYFLSSVRSAPDVLASAIAAALIVSSVGVVSDLGFGTRVTGWFNNPNQLAYYSLCAMAALLVIYRFRLPIRVLPIAGMISGLVGIFASASLAAMGGLLALSAAYLCANVTSIHSARKLVGVLLVIVAGFIAAEFGSGGYISDNVSGRMDRADAKLESWFEERRYDRIIAFPEYWAFGAGEGHLYRFQPYGDSEIHSSLGNMLFAYGLPGALLLSWLLIVATWRGGLSGWLVLAAPMIYSLTHMGLRTTMFWILIAVMWYVFSVARRSSARPPISGQERARPDPLPTSPLSEATRDRAS